MPFGRRKKSHLNRNKIESNLSVPGIQRHHENALIKSFETSSHLICLLASTDIPLGPASGSGLWIRAGLEGMLVLTYRHIKWGLLSKHL